ncbi:MAG: helix-turn-helix domain-containing protein [Methylocella sp.]
MEKVLLSIPEACATLGAARSHLYRMIRSQEISHVKLGRRTLIPMSSIRAIAEGGQHG